MKIVIKPALFVKLQKVYIIDEETQSIKREDAYPMEELSIKVPLLCKEYNVDKLTFAGNNIFNRKIGQAIVSNSISMYNLKIDIEYV